MLPQASVDVLRVLFACMFLVLFHCYEVEKHLDLPRDTITIQSTHRRLICFITIYILLHIFTYIRLSVIIMSSSPDSKGKSNHNALNIHRLWFLLGRFLTSRLQSFKPRIPSSLGLSRCLPLHVVGAALIEARSADNSKRCACFLRKTNVTRHVEI